jgi:hypothetical protein
MSVEAFFLRAYASGDGCAELKVHRTCSGMDGDRVDVIDWSVRLNPRLGPSPSSLHNLII